MIKSREPESSRLNLSDVGRPRLDEKPSAEAERLAAIGRMVASIGHESRNALQCLNARVELLKLKLCTDGNLEYLEDLRAIESASARLQRMLEDLREYSATTILECHPCRLGDLVESAWDNLRSIQQSAHHVRLSVCIPVCVIHADPFRLEQVFRNLLDNAIADGPGVSHIAVHASLTTAGGRSAVRIIVRDDGSGFSAEQRERAFEPFFTSKRKGTGLGLAICRRIIELHGGQIEIGASIAGACIEITLPCGLAPAVKRSARSRRTSN